ncbi:O-antigen ligase family protein [Demequina sp. SYSU T00039]|uniref:O-antigen ligase family protein n=1 Tax=Demequina lignilytica TaxID=3051663 RepID=A0AAW7M7B3_9MICO|nr:O-antigen ligase family protein [Demequina sp. SYSU T00039]MDN4486905.1 O-antigen ligase family protein [Demequina sp. SYSU T00039]
MRNGRVARCWRWTASRWGRAYAAVGAVVVLSSGQGFRYLLGIPLYLMMCAATVAAIVVAFRHHLDRVRVPWLIVNFVALAAITLLWSETRAVTALATVALAVVTLVAATIVSTTGRTQVMAYLYRGLQVSIGLGLLFELYVAVVLREPLERRAGDLARLSSVDPGALPPWSENLLLAGGPIQGFVGNRNVFDSLALLAGIIAVVLLLERRVRRLDGFLTLAAVALVHLLTMSATVSIAMLYVSVLAAAALLIRRAPARRKRVLSYLVLACSAVVAVATIKFRAEIFEMFDRSADATNRVFIWDETMRLAMARPEGWGYVGYWPIWHEPYRSVVDHVGVVVPHGHNAFLDAWMQMGLIGLALLLVIVVLTFGSAWRLVERASAGDTYIPLGWALLTAAIALEALAESRMLVDWGWFLLVVLYCSGPQAFTLTVVDPELVRTGAPAAERDTGEDPVLVLSRRT